MPPSSILCLHANETPRGPCSCPEDCPCREVMCGRLARLAGYVFPVIRRSPPSPNSYRPPPLRQNLDYHSVGRPTLLVEPLGPLSVPAHEALHKLLTASDEMMAKRLAPPAPEPPKTAYERLLEDDE